MSPIIHRIASITDLEVNWPREQTAWLSTFEQEQLQWCRHLQRQREWLAGRWLFAFSPLAHLCVLSRAWITVCL